MARGDVYLPENTPLRLGYRGILVKPVSQTKRGVLGIVKKRLLVGSNTKDLQVLLFGTMPKGLVSEVAYKTILEQINKGTVQPDVNPKRIKRYSPRFRIAPWASQNTRDLNNCYNYANAKITDTFALPGRGSNQPIDVDNFDGNDVRVAAESDGLLTQPTLAADPVPQNPALPDQRHVVALVIWPPSKYKLNLE